LHGSDFEAVDESSLMVDPNSGLTNVSAPSAPAATNAVEFHCAAADRYLLSADPALIAALDNACVPGWRRTGQSLNVYASTAYVSPNTSELCASPGRHGANVGAQNDARALACAASNRRFPNVWPQLPLAPPSPALPNEIDGSCAAGSIAVFGVVDARPDLNHRYTTSIVARDQLRALGWSASGNGPLGVAMCAPAP
jgi:hypothetical protein